MESTVDCNVSSLAQSLATTEQASHRKNKPGIILRLLSRVTEWRSRENAGAFDTSLCWNSLVNA